MKNPLNPVMFLLMALLMHQPVSAQLHETFNDGDFTKAPAWVGNTSGFAVNASLQLQSNYTLANSSFYLSTSSILATNVQWECSVDLAFATSGSNYADIWLIASQSDLTAQQTTGYFVRIGNTDDEICLYRKEANGNSIKIIDGVNGTVGRSNNKFKIKVTRDAANQWLLYHDNTGTGTNYITESATKDATFLTASCFGIVIKQSTASFFQKHFFDDIIISPYIPDTMAPAIQTVHAVTANTVEIIFTEALTKSNAQNVDNYTIAAFGKPASAVADPVNAARVVLTFASTFLNGNTYTIGVKDVTDLAGNVLTNTNITFTWFIPGRYSIIINEIMADPSPPVGLPNAEWIELKNTSAYPINLQDFSIGKTGTNSGNFPYYLLQPDSFLIVTSTAQVAALSVYGNAIGITSFPALNNDGDALTLQSNTGAIMHVVAFDESWYQNTIKSAGGWTLEMTDPQNPCGGITNWKASTNSMGGTPGKKNATNAINPDKTAPTLLRGFAKDSLTIVLYFDESLDSNAAADAASYSISDGMGNPLKALPLFPAFSKVTLLLSTPLLAGKMYTITANGVSDCAGNKIINFNATKTGLSVKADSLDIIINEILFDPPPLGVDYVELYNRSNKIIDLSELYITTINSNTGTLGAPIKISNDNHLLLPAAFLVLSANPGQVKKQYILKDEQAFLPLSLPAFPGDKGSAVLLNNAGEKVDALVYDSKWHFTLLDNTQGVSLERMDYSKPTNHSSNWTSAAAAAGFGTPGYQNSQFRAELQLQGGITINPKMFSPDNDGFEDFAWIEYQFPAPGYVANVTIFDAAGRRVKLLQRNTTTASKGTFRWDGLDDKWQKVPAGSYVVYTEIFNLEGKRKQFKNTVVVARKF